VEDARQQYKRQIVDEGATQTDAAHASMNRAPPEVGQNRNGERAPRDISASARVVNGNPGPGAPYEINVLNEIA